MIEFWLPMILLFLAATIASRRKRDRCLNYFNREPVMILMQPGKWLWGRFVAYPKAMELVFETPEADASGHKKASYVLYTPEVDGIKKILQSPPQAGSKEYDKWHKEMLEDGAVVEFAGLYRNIPASISCYAMWPFSPISVLPYPTASTSSFPATKPLYGIA